MRTIPVETIDGVKNEIVYSPTEYFYRDYLFSETCMKKGVRYINVPCAYDIETTNMITRENCKVISAYAFMYHWQFCIDDKVCFGRTWGEFLNFIDDLKWKLQLNRNRRLVVYVHNLPFEFQFMRRFINVSEGFFLADRQPLVFLCNNAIEFRDSYKLSNMSLAKFCENSEGVFHYKLVDTFDYNKIRTPKTPLIIGEEGYCYNDVRGLCECIRYKMREDNLATIPLTSTGYVRRDFRTSYAKNRINREYFNQNRLTKELYNICKLAFRGGDTHANVDHVSQVIRDVQSFDLQSSYPAAEMLDLYPVSKFFKITPGEFASRDLTGYAMLIHVRFTDIRYIGLCGNPYIPESRCVKVDKGAIIDNGRILFSEFVEMWLTDIDYNIILKEYSYKDIYVSDVYGSIYGELPKEFKDCLMNYYRKKTLLKGVKGSEYEYMKSKNKLNASYGMMVTDIAKAEVEYINGEFKKKECDINERLDKYYKSRKSFLSYQQGLWVTANARKRLRDMLWVVGGDNVYDDTDSIKCKGNHKEEFELKNKEIIEKCLKMGAYAEDRNGKVQYMGIWDYEGTYEEFKTLGAKKYIYKLSDGYHSTIAGVSKKAGRKYFEANGIDAFKVGAVIKESGHLVAYYNDDEEHEIEVQGVKIKTASNVALVDENYTIGITDSYKELLELALANKAIVI